MKLIALIFDATEYVLLKAKIMIALKLNFKYSITTLQVSTHL